MQQANITQFKFIPWKFDFQAAEINWQRLTESNVQLANKIRNYGAFGLTDSIFSNSSFLSDLIIKNAEFYNELVNGNLDEQFDNILKNIKDFTGDSEEVLMKLLRQSRQKAALLLAIAEITTLWDITRTTEELSRFADLTVSKTCEFLLKKYHDKSFIKLKHPTEPLKDSGLVVIALGKLGSNELNYSSDIDLCVFYEDEKLEYKGRISIGQFYINLAQDLIRILSERTKDGYVFRVDFRLRPDPGSNPLAVSLKKAEKYYFTVGQNWERAAYTKARFICGDEDSNKIFREFMDRNIWRKHLDFETIEDIHSIKRQIDTKQGLHPQNLYGYNIKLGLGGIREIEFFVQTQQLIWGGRKPRLRASRVIKILYALVREKKITSRTARDLEDAYLFYRMVEHRLQMVADEQTHTLPKNENEMYHIAIFCGYVDTISFLNVLHQKISLVREHYSHLFETSPSLASNLPEAQGSLIFTGTENHPDTIDTLRKMGFKNPERVSDMVRGWHHGRYSTTKSKRARAELTKLMPHLFVAFAKSPSPDIAFARFDEFLSNLTEHNQIFSMLYVHQNIMELLADIMGGYPEIAQNIAKNPALIEYVLAPEFYTRLPEKEELQRSLKREIKSAKNDLDEVIEATKNWANDLKFRLGIQLVTKDITTEGLFIGLSNIAETVIRTFMKLVNKEMEAQYGKIANGNFAVIAFGKFGSRELTFNSDLDLVFAYDFEKDNLDIPATAYYNRMVTKLVTMLSSVTAGGKLYEVDMRLRPLGESGPLASSLESLDNYYNPEKKDGSAWVFEYIALTRARVISNNPAFERKLSKLIRSKLQHKWKSETLLKEAKYIHERFRKTKRQKNIFDIKNAEGGLFDLEFLIRFLQLRNLYKHPKILGQSTVKTINALHKNKLINASEYKVIREAYTLYKEIQNILRITSETEVETYTEKLLCNILKIGSVSELHALITDTKQRVKNLFTKLI